MPFAPSPPTPVNRFGPPALVPVETGKAFRPGQPFSRAELQAMALDGLLKHVFGTTYVSPGIRIDAEIRAGAMAHELPPGLLRKAVIGRQSAAWIYGCAPAPARMNMLTNHQRRTAAAAPLSGCFIHEVQLTPAETVTIAGVEVTAPVRTARDVALYQPQHEAAASLRALTASRALDCTLVEVKTALEALVRVPRKRAALALVDALMEQ